MKKIPCLEDGIFALKTLKKIENIYDRDLEKKWLETMFASMAWFSVCGLRRTGKTTLVRSIADALERFSVIYLNAWELPEESVFESFLERLRDEVISHLEMQKLKSLARRIRRLSFLGVSVEIRDKSQLKLVGALKELIKTKPLIIIIDEAPYLLETKKAQKFFAALHDVYVPKLLIVFTGSIITLKHIYEKNETRPLYGRIEEEITLEPFDEYNSRRYLETGFKQCGIEPPQELIEAAILRLGGFPGWLTLLGRIATRQKLVLGKINTQETIKELEERASKVVIGEIAKFLRLKRNFKIYIKILKKISIEAESTLTEISRAISRDPSTTTFYLDQLALHGIVKKTGKTYQIPDPILRKTIQKPNFEKEVKIRL